MKVLVQRILAPLAVLMVLTACGGKGAQPTPVPPENRPPVFSLVPQQGSPIPGQAGSWCWNQSCVDLEAPPAITDYLFIPENRLTIRSEPPSPNAYSLTLLSGDASGDIAATTSIVPDGDSIEWIPTVRGGNYVLLVEGTWADSSNASYYFGISLPGQTAELPLPGEEGASRPPNLLLLLPDGTEQIAELGTYCWTTMCVDTIWPPPMTNQVSIPLGSALSLRFSEAPARTMHIQLLDAAAIESDPGVPQEPLAQTEVEVSADGTASWTPEGLAAGRYLLLIFANWRGAGQDTTQQGGDASYSFVLNMQ
jgi:hypothetical protein